MKLKLIALCTLVATGCASVEKKESFFAWPENYKFLPLGEELAVKPKPVVQSHSENVSSAKTGSSTNAVESFAFDVDYLDLKSKPKELVKVENPQPKPLPVVAVNKVAPVDGDDGVGVFFIQIGAFKNKADAERSSMAHSNAKVFKEGDYFKVGIFGFETFYIAKREARHYLNSWIRKTENVKSALTFGESPYKIAKRPNSKVKEVQRPLLVAVAEEPKTPTPIVAEEPKTPTPVVAEEPKAPTPVVAEEPKTPTPVVAEEPVKNVSPVALVPLAPKKKTKPKSAMLSEFLSTGLRDYPKVVWRVNKKNGSGLDYKITLTDIWLNSDDAEVLKLVKSNFPVSLCQLADRTLVVIHRSANCVNWNNL